MRQCPGTAGGGKRGRPIASKKDVVLRLLRGESVDALSRELGVEMYWPQPKVSDTNLLAAIRTDLAASPFVGEGHRKGWVRLRLAGVRVARKRGCRLMRENSLLSPHPVPKGLPDPHTGTIITTAPDVMWGTDGIRSKPWMTAGPGSSRRSIISTPNASAGRRSRSARMAARRSASDTFGFGPRRAGWSGTTLACCWA